MNSQGLERSEDEATFIDRVKLLSLGPDPKTCGLCLTYQVSKFQERESDVYSLEQVHPSPTRSVFYGDVGKHRCPDIFSREGLFQRRELFVCQ